MAKKHTSIQLVFTLSFVLLVSVIAILVFTASLIQSKQEIRDQIVKIAAIAATQVDGDIIASFTKKDEGNKEFLAIRDNLLKMQKSHPDIKYMYTFRAAKDKDGKDQIEYVVDAEWGIADDAVKLGDYEEEDTTYCFAGLLTPTAEKEVVDTEWGPLLSGYAPIYGKDGKIKGAVGVDIMQNTISEKQKMFGMSSYAVIIIIMFLASAFIAVFSMAVVRDIKKLTKAADEISKGNLDHPVNIKRNDEIGELSESFDRMRASLKIMTSMDDK